MPTLADGINGYREYDPDSEKDWKAAARSLRKQLKDSQAENERGRATLRNTEISLGRLLSAAHRIVDAAANAEKAQSYKGLKTSGPLMRNLQKEIKQAQEVLTEIRAETNAKE